MKRKLYPCCLPWGCALCALAAPAGRLDAGPLPRLRAAHKAHPFKRQLLQKAQRLEGFYQVLEDAEPLDKEFLPVYILSGLLLELRRNGQTTTAYVDVNGQYIDFYYEGEEQLYRSTPPRRNSGSWCIRIEHEKPPKRLLGWFFFSLYAL